jgi:acetyl-CoA C-acetyltransferase
MTNIFILAAQRSAIGSYGGSLKDTAPIDLAVPVAKDAIAKSGVPADAIGHAVYGHVIHTEPRDMYSPRCIAIGAGLAETAPAFQVNRLCGSGLQAIVSATQLISLGDCDTALAGGVEVMSRGPYSLPAQR